MDIQARLIEAEQKFNTKKEERENHLKAAQDRLEEMCKLQEEHRLLKELEASVEPEPEPTVESNIIDVTTEGE